MSKKQSYAYVFLFLLLLVLPTVVFGVFGEHIDQTNYEQRNAAEKPVFSWETITTFPEKYEMYFNDRIPFRTQLIEAHSLINYSIFQQSPVSSVIIGDDGWLFYNPAGTDGDPIADYRGLNLYTQEQLQQCADNLITIRDEFAQQGRKFVLLFVPNKESMYGPSFMPTKYTRFSKMTRVDQVVEYLQERTDLAVVDVKAYMLQVMEDYPEYDLYYKTDTHWNSFGGYIGACALMDAFEIELPDINQIDVSVTSGGSGDLAQMTGLTDHMRYDNSYSVGFKENVSVPNDSRRMLFMGDSFRIGMAQYVSTVFPSFHMIHRAEYTPELIQELQPDVIVFEIVERYLDELQYISLEIPAN